MKKAFALVFAIVLVTGTFAQDIKSKNGTLILPQEGDWAIGFDAAPYLEYLGNLMNGTDQQGSPFSNFTANSPTMTLYGKYCAASNKFYRGRLRIGYGSTSQDYAVLDKPTATDTIAFNETYNADQTQTSNLNVNLGAGMEWRRGHGRVQGYYGPEVWLGFGTGKTSYTFANATDEDMTQNSASIVTFTGDPDAITTSGKRITEMKNGSMFTVGVRGFAGVEWFFMADASIGAEFGWGIGLTSTGAGETTTEYYEPALNNGDGGVRSETIDDPGKNSNFSLDTDNASGSINLFFYF